MLLFITIILYYVRVNVCKICSLYFEEVYLYSQRVVCSRTQALSFLFLWIRLKINKCQRKSHLFVSYDWNYVG